MHKSFDALTRVLELVSSVYGKLGTNNLWWRGHAEQEWLLDPKVYRNNYTPWDEYNFIWTFEQQAPVRYPNWPEDRARRLTLMQHYGLPTRLLDWSFSLFTALYFSVCNKKKDDKNGLLWALDPQRYCQVKGNSRVFEAQPVCSGTKNQQLRDCHEAKLGGSNR